MTGAGANGIGADVVWVDRVKADGSVVAEIAEDGSGADGSGANGIEADGAEVDGRACADGADDA